MKINLLKIFPVAILFAVFQGCSDDDELIVDTSNYKIEIADKYEVTRFKEIEVKPTIKGFEGATFKWKIGDSIISKEQNLNFSSLKAGNFNLKLIVKNKSKTDSVSSIINVPDVIKGSYETDRL